MDSTAKSQSDSPNGPRGATEFEAETHLEAVIRDEGEFYYFYFFYVYSVLCFGLWGLFCGVLVSLFGMLSPFDCLFMYSCDLLTSCPFFKTFFAFLVRIIDCVYVMLGHFCETIFFLFFLSSCGKSEPCALFQAT